MQKPSAWITATARAAHQLYDQPPIFNDPLALRILGPEREAELRADVQRQQHPLAASVRATMAVRARLAEDSWHEAQARGVQQYVILGAGLDTYAYRATLTAATIYEVDLPAMQQWKRDCLRTADIREPAHVRYVATDFTDGSLLEDLQQQGLDAAQPACFSWLGVSMYLHPDEVMRALREIADCAPGSSIVFDYCVHRKHLTDNERAGLNFVAASLAAQGEPLQSSFEPQLLEHMLRHHGFRHIEHFGAGELGARYGARLSGIFRLIRATV
jgi:methyltransferase (TIGR00027 family)